MQKTEIKTAPKPKPILFTTAMVKAILRGNKTQTRRLAKDKTSIKENDTYYVRETFCKDGDRIIYRASVCSKWDIPDGCKWKPSLFMPKDIARIFLQIKEVRTENLQDISEEDCIKEGIREVEYFDGNYTKKTGYVNPKREPLDYVVFITAKEAFQDLWEQINGKESWESNPKVNVISFSVLGIENIKSLFP